MSKEVNWQAECLKKGFEYVRESDDHYVIADPAEMVALLRDLLGVDVRSKDGDSYGVSVSDLQEQIDGLVNTLHAQQVERDALLAERVAMAETQARHVPLNEALQRAAGELPQGWEIRLCVERGAGWVELYDPVGDDIGDFATNAERLDFTVIDALEHALKGHQP